MHKCTHTHFFVFFVSQRVWLLSILVICASIFFSFQHIPITTYNIQFSTHVFVLLQCAIIRVYTPCENNIDVYLSILLWLLFFLFSLHEIYKFSVHMSEVSHQLRIFALPYLGEFHSKKKLQNVFDAFIFLSCIV